MRTILWLLLLSTSCMWDDAKYGDKVQRELARISALCDPDADTDPGVGMPTGANVVCDAFKPNQAYRCVRRLRAIRACPADDFFLPRICIEACQNAISPTNTTP